MDNLLFELENILGHSTPSSSGERLFHCPFCHHRKPKLSINFGRRYGMWKCWVCDQAGRKISTLLYRLGYSGKEIAQILDGYQEPQVEEEEDTERVLRLPPEYEPLWVPNRTSYEYKNALRYLKRRGVRKTDILRYRMGYAEDGKYRNRIIIPSYDRDNQLNYFVARAYYDNKYPYFNPAASKNVILFENLINWSMPITLVEGIFDAIAVRRNSIPLFGKLMSDRLKQQIIEERPPGVYVMLDPDASREAHEIEYYLKNININVSMVNAMTGDPADMGFEQSNELIKCAKPASFTDLIQSKL